MIERHLSNCRRRRVSDGSRDDVLCQGDVMLRNFVVVVLALFSALHSESYLCARNEDAGGGAQSAQASTASEARPQRAVSRRRSHQQRSAMKQNKCLPPSSSESTKSDESQPPTIEAPPLILDPTDREPGPPQEIIPQHIDPADMPAIKRPPKKKKNPQ